MSKVILDTDIFSEILLGQNTQVMTNAAAYVAENDVLTFTSVTLYEIVTGFEHKQAQRKLAKAKSLFRLNEEIVPESADYELAGQILGTLRRVGKEVGYSDPLIASCTVRRGLILVTGNLKHFRFIHEAGFPIRLNNWREA